MTAKTVVHAVTSPSASGNPPVLLIGPGAIGTFVAARLVRAGHPVTVACRTAQTAEKIAARGLVATDHKGTRLTVQVRAIHDPRRLEANPHLALLATKCQDAPRALTQWVPHLGADCPVVGLQNGLMGDELARIAAGRYVESVVHFPATLEATGKSLQTGPGGFHLGLWPNPAGPDGQSGTPAHVARAAEVLRHAGDVTTTENIVGAKWTKLIINSCITTLGVVTGQPLGALLEDRRARDAFLAVTSEGHRVGRAEGVRFETVQRFHPARFALDDDAGAIARGLRHAVLRVLARRHRRHRSSSLQSLERGARTEVDHLNGVIVDAGRRHGVATPVNARLVEVVHAIERGDTRPALQRLDGLAS